MTTTEFFTSSQLTGQSDDHVIAYPEQPEIHVHQAIIPALQELISAAAAEGLRIKIVSGFRSFERQAMIWNAKYAGQRTLYDLHQQPLSFDALSPIERIHAIMLWSALPGASRHHWGTDLDIIDEAGLPEGTSAQLLPEEFAKGGPFHRLHGWLAQHLERFSFYRPYAHYHGGVGPEPWHISYQPLASQAAKQFNLELLDSTITASDLFGKAEILAHLPALYARYVECP